MPEASSRGSPCLVTQRQGETGRSAADEAWVWDRALPKLAAVLALDTFKPLHRHVRRLRNAALEYGISAAASWADGAVLGR